MIDVTTVRRSRPDPAVSRFLGKLPASFKKEAHPQPGGPPLEAEFYMLYKLYIEPQVIEGKRAHLVLENHGWWDETERKPKHLVQTFGPEEGFPTFDEALVEYESHRWAQSIERVRTLVYA